MGISVRQEMGEKAYGRRLFGCWLMAETLGQAKGYLIGYHCFFDFLNTKFANIFVILQERCARFVLVTVYPTQRNAKLGKVSRTPNESKH